MICDVEKGQKKATASSTSSAIAKDSSSPPNLQKSRDSKEKSRGRTSRGKAKRGPGRQALGDELHIEEEGEEECTTEIIGAVLSESHNLDLTVDTSINNIAKQGKESNTNINNDEEQGLQEVQINLGEKYA